MNNNIYDDEATRFENSQSETSQTPQSSQNSYGPRKDNNKANANKAGKNNIWPRVAASAGAGVVIGGLSTMFMSMGENPKEGDNSPHSDDHGKSHLSHPELVSGDIDVASSVNDNMSFNEAFAAARAEVGAGGVFEWHGQIYSTYLAQEWDSMSPSQRAEYESHFAWNNNNHSTNDVTGHSIHSDTAMHTSHAGHDDISVVSVDSSDAEIEADVDNWLSSQNENHSETGDHDFLADANLNPGSELGHDIEILGVSYDSETNSHIGNMTIDGQEVILVDVDGDMQFDYMGIDFNDNGYLDSNELTPINEEHLTVDDLGDFYDQSDDMLSLDDNMHTLDDGLHSLDDGMLAFDDSMHSLDDGPDYISDGCYEG